MRVERRLRVFENRVLRRIFGPKRDEVRSEWRKIHNEELNDLYCSPNIVRVMQSKRMKWVKYVAYMVETKGVYRDLGENLRKRHHLKDPDVDGGIIFVNNQLDAQFFFIYVYFYSLHVSGSHVPIIRKINCINTTSGICHCV
jgi:hypothetical protein